MILKSYIIEKNVELLNNYQATLLYGENNGLKEDIKLKIKNLNKNAEIISFFEEEILKKKNVLYENFINESLFNEHKIFLIEQATDKIFDIIAEILETKKNNVKIYIFSEILDKKSKLRNFFEKDKTLAVFPCYEDNERTLIEYINKELKGFKGVTGELVNIIIGNSGSNRRIIQNEIVKIKIFFVDKLINKKDLLEILNIIVNSDFEEIRDNALIGKKNRINKLLSEVELLSDDSFYYLNNLNYRIQKLIEIQRINETFNNHEKSLENIKPPVFWKDKPVYLLQLKKWDISRLDRLATKIGNTELLMKSQSHLRNDVIMKNLIVSITQEVSISS